MTIAAGFACSDGIVLCSDTQLTSTYKQQGQKLWLHNGAKCSVAVTGAGDYVLLKLANESIRERLRDRMSLDDVVHGVIEPVVRSIHEDHIDRAPDWRVHQGYDLFLIVGVRTASDGVRLYETSRTGVALIHDYRCVGAGAPVGNYIAGNLFSPSLPVLWGQVCAAYLIQQTTVYGLDCGGASNIVVVPSDGTARVVTAERLQVLELVANGIHTNLGRVLFLATDFDGGDDNAFNKFWESVQMGRNAILHEHMAEYFAKQTRPNGSDHTGRPVRKAPRRARKGRKPSQA